MEKNVQKDSGQIATVSEPPYEKPRLTKEGCLKDITALVSQPRFTRTDNI